MKWIERACVYVCVCVCVWDKPLEHAGLPIPILMTKHLCRGNEVINHKGSPQSQSTLSSHSIIRDSTSVAPVSQDRVILHTHTPIARSLHTQATARSIIPQTHIYSRGFSFDKHNPGNTCFAIRVLHDYHTNGHPKTHPLYNLLLLP